MAGGTIATEEVGEGDVMTGMVVEEGGGGVLVPLLVVGVVTRVIAARPVVRLRLTARRLLLDLGLAARRGMVEGEAVVRARVVGEEEEEEDGALALVVAPLPRLVGTRLVK